MMRAFEVEGTFWSQLMSTTPLQPIDPASFKAANYGKEQFRPPSMCLQVRSASMLTCWMLSPRTTKHPLYPT